MATIKYWNGSAWELAIVGKQGPAGPTGPTGPAGSASLQRFRFVATGGETSLSGTDANGNTLAYTAGLEEVFLNGAALVRGQDYVATNGTSITSLAALVATDVVEILAWGVFNVANTISNTLVDAKGDILAGTGADSVGRLAVGSNGTVLTADSAEATGLKWAAPAGGTLTLSQIASGSITTGTQLSLTSLSNYDTLMLQIHSITTTTSSFDLQFRINSNSTSVYNATYGFVNMSGPNAFNSASFSRDSSSSQFTLNRGYSINSTVSANSLNIKLTNCKNAGFTTFEYQFGFNNGSSAIEQDRGQGIIALAEAVSSIQLIKTGSNFTGGDYVLWGG